MKDANPAKVGMDEDVKAPNDTDIDAKRKREPDEPQNGPENDDRQQAVSSTTAEAPSKRKRGRQSSKKTSS